MVICKYCQRADCESKTCRDRARREKKRIWNASRRKDWDERPHQYAISAKRVEDENGNPMLVGLKEFDSQDVRRTWGWLKRASLSCTDKGGDFIKVLSDWSAKWHRYSEHDLGTIFHKFTGWFEKLRKEGKQIPKIPEQFIEEMRKAYPDFMTSSLNARMRSFA